MRANTAFVVLCNTPVVFFSKQERSDGGKKKAGVRCLQASLIMLISSLLNQETLNPARNVRGARSSSPV